MVMFVKMLVVVLVSLRSGEEKRRRGERGEERCGKERRGEERRREKKTSCHTRPSCHVAKVARVAKVIESRCQVGELETKRLYTSCFE